MNEELKEREDEEQEAQGPRIRIGVIVTVLVVLFLGVYTAQHPDCYLAHLMQRAR